jgi:hypothetical protein
MTAPLTMFQEDNTCVKVYDVETKEVIITFPNYKRAGIELGIAAATISQRCSSKKRLFVPKLNKEVACRLAKKDG